VLTLKKYDKMAGFLGSSKSRSSQRSAAKAKRASADSSSSSSSSSSRGSGSRSGTTQADISAAHQASIAGRGGTSQQKAAVVRKLGNEE